MEKTDRTLPPPRHTGSHTRAHAHLRRGENDGHAYNMAPLETPAASAWWLGRPNGQSQPRLRGWARWGSCRWHTQQVPAGSRSAAPPKRAHESGSNAKGQGAVLVTQGVGGARGARRGPAAQTDCTIWGQEAPRVVLSGLHWRTRSREAQASGEVESCDSKWLSHLQAGSGGQLAERSRRKHGFWLSPGNRSLAVTRILGHAPPQGRPARDPLTTHF